MNNRQKQITFRYNNIDNCVIGDSS